MTYKLKTKFLSRRIYRRLKNQSDRWSGCYYSLLCFHLDHVISYNALARKPTYATKQGQVTDSSEVSSIVQLVTEQFSVTAHLWPNLVCRVPPQTGGHCRKVGCTVKKFSGALHRNSCPSTFNLLPAPLATDERMLQHRMDLYDVTTYIYILLYCQYHIISYQGCLVRPLLREPRP